MHYHHLDHKQTRWLAFAESKKEVSHRPTTPRTHWNSGLLYHYGYIVPPDSARVGQEAPAKRRPQCIPVAARCYLRHGSYNRRQGHYLVWMCKGQDNASTGPRPRLQNWYVRVFRQPRISAN